MLFIGHWAPPKSAKELGTFQTRCLHWFTFCLDTKLDNDMALERVTIHQRCNWQLALYAVHLAMSHTVSCRSIKAVTIDKYLEIS
jgi:hypothetical protein